MVLYSPAGYFFSIVWKNSLCNGKNSTALCLLKGDSFLPEDCRNKGKKKVHLHMTLNMRDARVTDVMFIVFISDCIMSVYN